MPENYRYSGPKTLIEMTADGIVSKYYVPFSEREVEALSNAREGRNNLWVIVKHLDSDVARRLYADAPIPWAFGLQNREKAIKEIESSAEIYRKILEDEKMTESLLDFRGIVEQVYQNLNLLLPRQTTENKD